MTPNLKIHSIQIQSRSMSEPPLSDIDFKNEVTWVWTTLKLNIYLESKHLLQWKQALSIPQRTKHRLCCVLGV